MKFRAFFFGIPIILLTVFSIILLYKWKPPTQVETPPTPPPLPRAEPTLTIIPNEAKVRVAQPELGARIENPLVVHGEARGSWFFEASFPIELITATGTVLARGNATALGEWMTVEFVPFTTTLSWATTTATSGELVLHKSNPSGLPEYDELLRVPVLLQ